MKLIHDHGYSADERESFKEIIFSNIVQSMRVIIDAMEFMGLQVQPENKQNVAVIMELPNQIEGGLLPHEISVAIKNLWMDPGVLACFQRSREYQLNDSAK